MGKNNFRKIATITLFESAVQWYCFLLYGTAAGTVFNKVFFSQTGNGTTALILSYMSFAIGYIAGPFGAIFFGHIGDRKGRVGFGTGKANEVPDAIRKASEAAKRNVIRVPMIHGTIPHEVNGMFGSGNVFLKPASQGTGIIAGGPVRAVVELAGYSDILSKSLGSRTPINMVRATMEGLASLKTAQQVAELRDKKVEEIYG